MGTKLKLRDYGYFDLKWLGIKVEQCSITFNVRSVAGTHEQL